MVFFTELGSLVLVSWLVAALNLRFISSLPAFVNSSYN